MATDNAPQAEALSGSDFDAGNIISDAAFFDAAALTLQEIEAVLDARGSGCVAGEMPCLKDYVTSTPATSTEAGLCQGMSATSSSTAGEIIHRVGLACGISPKVLIVLLQKEQSLITRSQPTLRSYQAATGFACPDTAPCDAQYYGFFNQVYRAARQFKVYTTNPTRYGYQKGRFNNILYNPSSACGTAPVYIRNQATANLYIYTPYQPNAAALANLYGTGDACSAYGNRNFWRFYNDWFGTTIDPGSPMFTNTGGVPLRAQASDSSTVLLTLPAGVQVGGFEPQISGYYRVRYGAVSGYVRTAWLSQNPTPTHTLYTSTNAVPVYLGPGAEYHLAGYVNVDTAMGASTSLVNGHVHVVFGATGGWVNQAYLRTDPSGPLVVARTGKTNTGGVPVLAAPDPAAAVVSQYGPATSVPAALGEYNGFVKVSHDGAAAWVSSSWLTFPPFVTGSAVTNTSSVPVYLGPGTQFHPAGVVAARVTFKTGATTGGFVHVEWDGGGAWIASEWLSTNPVATGSAITNTNGIPVMLGPGVEYAQAGTADAARWVPTAEKKNGYTRVVWGTSGGWIGDRWLSTNPVPTGTRMTNTNGIPVYLGPGTEYALAGGLNAKQVVQTERVENGYVRVVFGSTGGWVDSRWLSNNPAPAGTAMTNTNGVPVYLGPGSGYALAGGLSAGVPVSLGAMSTNGYTQVVFGSYGGWIDSRWLASQADGTGISYTVTNGVPIFLGPGASYLRVGEMAAGTAVWTADETNGYVHIVYGQYGAWVPKQWLSSTPVTNPAAIATALTNTNGVPVLNGPGGGASTIGVLSAKTTVAYGSTVINGYVQVRFGKTGGWIKQSWLATNPTPNGTRRAITSGIPVYLGPGPGYVYLGETSAGTTVSVSAETVRGYVHIVYGQYGAWVPAKWFA